MNFLECRFWICHTSKRKESPLPTSTTDLRTKTSEAVACAYNYISDTSIEVYERVKYEFLGTEIDRYVCLVVFQYNKVHVHSFSFELFSAGRIFSEAVENNSRGTILFSACEKSLFPYLYKIISSETLNRRVDVHTINYKKETTMEMNFLT